MGKKIKKAFKKVGKVLTTAGPLGKMAKDIVKAPINAAKEASKQADRQAEADRVFAEQQANEAARLQAEQIAAAKRANDDALRQQKMFNDQAQLLSDNTQSLMGTNVGKDTAMVEVGGTDTPDVIAADMKRRKPSTKRSTASQLGII